MSDVRGWRRWPEPLTALLIMGFFVTAAFATSGIEAKYRIAAVVAFAGSAVLIAHPERKIACVVLWVLIHPLSVERVFFINAAEGPQFFDPSVAINASDGPLLLLTLFLVVETCITGRNAFRWSRLTTLLLLLLLWSGISYAIHAFILDDGFVTSSPLALLHNFRLLVFVLLIQSAIRSRADILLVLSAVAFALLLQTGFVALSYTTGQLFSYASATSGENTELMRFESSGGSELVRGVGTIGQTNEQAAFHAFITTPLIAFFVARSRFVRVASFMVVAGSAFAILLTFSRGAWVSFPLGLLVAGVIAWRRGLMGRTAMMVGAGFVLASAVLAIFLAKPVYERLVYGDSGATESRLRMLVLARDLLESNPIIGVGPGEYVEAAMKLYPPTFSESQWVGPGEALPLPAPYIGRVDITQFVLNGVVVTRPLPVHNKYMLIASELGLPGLVLWIWFFCACARIAWRCAKTTDPVLQLLGIAGIGVVVTEMTYQMLDLFVGDKPLEIMLFMPALLFAASRCAGAVPSARPPAAI